MRRSRELAGLSRAQMGQTLGYAESSVSRFECDRMKPRRGTLRTWAEVTRVDFDWLCNEDEEALQD